MTAPGIHGLAADGFEAVRDAFAANFAERGDVGAAVCVYRDGRPVVDLWGGLADPATGAPWERDTIVCMLSVGKGVAALCALMLVDRGRLDLAAPVSRYWPGFARMGKQAITVEELLSGRAALVFLDHAGRGAVSSREAMVEAIEAQAPAWDDRSRGAYHSATYGPLVAELVRRADGRPIERFLQEEVTGPLGADYQYGVRAEDRARTADVIPNPDSTSWAAIQSGAGPLGRAWKILPEDPDFLMNSDAFRSIVFPTLNGHGNARGVARIFAALAQGGTLDGVRLLSPETIERARTPQWNGPCGLTGRPFGYGLGFFVNDRDLVHMGPNPHAFGHPGIGGYVGFADPEAGIAFSYSPSAMCPGASLGERNRALVDAVYASLG